MNTGPDSTSPLLVHSRANEAGGPNIVGAIVLTALAGGLGWGIRGQYGHETGAMIAGVLVGFTLILLFLPHASSLTAARAVAMFAIGISIGGSMTYGQTIGLTQDPDLIGHRSALLWGLLGLFIKGGIWIAWGGALLGMGLSGKRYGPVEVPLLMVGLLLAFFAGVWLLNRPFDPAHRELPRIYFSATWTWKPQADLKPRPECWGGLLLALVVLIGYLQWVRRDALARNLAAIGFLGGGLGFSGGQSVQALHAWHRAWFSEGFFASLEPHVNWWNMMEISFGMIFGAVLAVGLWLNRHQITRDAKETPAVLSVAWEWGLMVIYTSLLVAAEFADQPAWELLLEFGLVIGILPLLGILGGRYWPYLYSLTIVAIPIVGKTLRELAYEHDEISPLLGWVVLVVIPLVAATRVAIWLAEQGREGGGSRSFARWGLLTVTWLYFGINLFFFRCPWPWQPWPWQPWTGRTPSALIFACCAIGLTIGVMVIRDRPLRPVATDLVPETTSAARHET